MRRIISRSNWRKLAATLVAVGGFVLLYEATATIDALLPFSGTPVNPASPVPGAQLQFSATAYCKGNTTASGVEVRTGIAAADKSLLPVGSVVTVTTDNRRYNGVYTVMDTGPEVQGRELDLYMWSCKEALAFGRKQVRVDVLRLGWNPSASQPGLIDRIFRRPPRRAVSVPQEPPPPATLPADGEKSGGSGADDSAAPTPAESAPKPPLAEVATAP
jgi:3D (Asp-Asp-Asp) domain-containing protein